jgi:hypothetical protein
MVSLVPRVCRKHLVSLSALSFELSATPAFSLLPMRLGYFYLTQNVRCFISAH